MWLNASQQSIVGCDTGSRDMLPHRCSNCGHTEDEESQMPMTDLRVLHSTQDCPGYFHVRLLRTARVISVTLVLLLGMVMALVALLLFGSPFLSHQNESERLPSYSPPEALSQKLRGLEYSSASLTAKIEDGYIQWQDEKLTGGFTYYNGNLTVPTAGRYRVNLQLTFQFVKHHSDLCAGHTLPLKISVEVFRPTYPTFVSLLSSEDTMSCSMDWTKSMHTTGSFTLEAHSLLRVHTLYPELLFKQDTHTIFQVERLSS